METLTTPLNEDVNTEIVTPEVPVEDAPLTEVEETTQEEQAKADAIWNDDLSDETVNDLFKEPLRDTTNPQEVEALVTTENTIVDEIGAFMVEKPVLKFKGRDIPIDSQDELIALAQKGFSFETEMANIKPQKKVLSIVDGIPLDVLQAVSDLNNGKDDALAFLQERYGIEMSRNNDVDDLFADEVQVTDKPTTYKPEMEVEDPIQSMWGEFANANQTAAAKVSEIYGQLEPSFQAELYKEGVFPSFIKSVSDGEFDRVYPLVVKEKSLNPAMTWLQAYGQAVSKSGKRQEVNTEPPASVRPVKQQVQPRNGGEGDRAAQVWADDSYYKEVEAKLFG